MLSPVQRTLWRVPRNRKRASRRHISAHYDLGNDLFALYLDESMMYSSAVFPDPEASLAEGQLNRLERICQALELTPEDHLLEIGTGSGYSAAVLARLARHVISIERVPELGEAARSKLEELGTANVEVIVGDGSRGYPESAPYDAIAIHAATPEAPHSLISELGTDGRLVVPIATGSADLLTAFIRQNGDLRQETIGPCRFVPLIGVEGFQPPDPRE